MSTIYSYYSFRFHGIHFIRVRVSQDGSDGIIRRISLALALVNGEGFEDGVVARWRTGVFESFFEFPFNESLSEM
jgi:hypothetical protein